jgi:hypothetical protein
MKMPKTYLGISDANSPPNRSCDVGIDIFRSRVMMVSARAVLMYRAGNDQFAELVEKASSRRAL